MTTVDLASELNATELDPKVKVEPERDRWGRYIIPDPETGEMRGWVRASTVSRGLADTTALDSWMKRNLVYGIGQREDLFLMAASAASPNEKGTLDQIIDAAYEVSASTAGANLGTGIHRLTERVDNGETVEVPAKWRKDVQAYVDTMKAHGVRVVDHFTERILLNTHIDVAGTCDRFLGRDDWPLDRVGDVKTGKNVVAKMDEIAGQLAIYANATHWYDPATKTLQEMPEVDKEVAIVMHLPVGQGKCFLYEVDIAAGWEAIQHEIAIREWRKRKDLCVPLSTWEPKNSTGGVDEAVTGAAADPSPVENASEFDPREEDVDLFEARAAWVKGRALAIRDAGHGKELAELWGEACADVPTFRDGGPRTHIEIDRAAGVCNLVETAHRLPFFDPDPQRARDKKPNNKMRELLG